MSRHFDKRVPLPFVPPRPYPEETLAAHIKRRDDPHHTLDLISKVVLCRTAPVDLTGLKKGDVVIVTTTGEFFAVDYVSDVLSLVLLPSRVTADVIRSLGFIHVDTLRSALASISPDAKASATDLKEKLNALVTALKGI